MPLSKAISTNTQDKHCSIRTLYCPLNLPMITTNSLIVDLTLRIFSKPFRPVDVATSCALPGQANFNRLAPHVRAGQCENVRVISPYPTM